MSFAAASLLFAFAAPVLLPLLAWLLGRLIRYSVVAGQQRYWSRQTSVYAEYEPPDGLLPAELAYLYDGVFGEPELLATIFDLEHKGHLTLRRAPAVAGDVDFHIHRTHHKHTKGLKDFELDIIGSAGDHGITWSHLKATTELWKSTSEHDLHRELQQQGYFMAPGFRWNKLLTLGLPAAAISAVTILFPIYLSGYNQYNTRGLGPDFVQLGTQINNVLFVLMFIVATAMYATALYFVGSAYSRGFAVAQGTARLRHVWPHIAGYRMYLEVVEQDRIRFHNETDREKARHDALRYAVAGNLSTRWQERFRHAPSK